jgi:hypothetical protein
MKILFPKLMHAHASTTKNQPVVITSAEEIGACTSKPKILGSTTKMMPMNDSAAAFSLTLFAASPNKTIPKVTFMIDSDRLITINFWKGMIFTAMNLRFDAIPAIDILISSKLPV